MRPRIEQELEVLRRHYPDVEHIEAGGEDWFLLSRYPFPPGWLLDGQPVGEAPVAFKISAAYPTAEPYGFAGPAGLTFEGAPPGNPGSFGTPPFQGAWHQFSWAPEAWQTTASLDGRSNLLSWARGFAERLRQGA